MQSAMTGVFLSLIASVAIADQAPASPAVDKPGATLITLGDSDMDKIAAGGQVTTTTAQASALQGRAFSISTTKLITNKAVTVSTARSVAVAVGVSPQATTSAGAAQF